jgi:hypothetical protein
MRQGDAAHERQQACKGGVFEGANKGGIIRVQERFLLPQTGEEPGALAADDDSAAVLTAAVVALHMGRVVSASRKSTSLSMKAACGSTGVWMGTCARVVEMEGPSTGDLEGVSVASFLRLRCAASLAVSRSLDV